MKAIPLSRNLGWFSIGLGLVELLAPRSLARRIGVHEQNENLIRLLGARELAAGAGLLARPKPTMSMWSRVVGDLMDLALLGTALARHDSQPAALRHFGGDQRRRTLGALTAVAAVTVVDLAVSLALSRPQRVEPQWRYTPAGGRSGLPRTTTPAPASNEPAPIH
jgi:hypothetical protein